MTVVLLPTLLIRREVAILLNAVASSADDSDSKAQISLREFMDLAVSETKDAEPEQVTTPLLDVRGIGKYGFYSIIAEFDGDGFWAALQ